MNRAQNRKDLTQAAFKKVNSELKRLRSQFSKTKRENEILQQVKDSLSRRLQAEEQRNLQLTKESQRIRKESTSTSRYDSEIRELRTKLAIAEAEREAAQSLANVRVRHEKMFFLTEEETRELCFRWVLLYWYWSVAEKLGLFPQVASANAAHWGNILKTFPWVGSDGTGVSVSDVALLLRYPREGEAAAKGRGSSKVDGKAEEEAGVADRRYTLHDLINAETSLRSLYEMELDNRVHAQLVERTRAQILPVIRDLGNPFSSVSLDDLLLDSSLDTNLTFTHDYIIWIQLNRLWLGYVWGKACKKHIEPHLAEARRDLWWDRAQGELTCRDVIDVQQAVKELHALQIESQLWVSRSKASMEP
ncbi:hypothetical protein A3770_14p71110 [Chloropicon primus]|uniref:Uncharacterized protein n=1 Tax=Chloropicon primus TaxID=1764295 RepID=A0A5B8MVL8_9CHLO|nr:hypothetical protein A3770_14p71110 [Chloropicon primus]|eukprot:QDZ24593.1 hypothetical protein A3770_14p71110 [Chloropicon primus]